MQSEKGTHEKLAERRETQNANYKTLLQNLYEYEKTGLDYYGRVDAKSMVEERRLVYLNQDLDNTLIGM